MHQCSLANAVSSYQARKHCNTVIIEIAHSEFVCLEINDLALINAVDIPPSEIYRNLLMTSTKYLERSPTFGHSG